MSSHARCGRCKRRGLVLLGGAYLDGTYSLMLYTGMSLFSRHIMVNTAHRWHAKHAGDPATDLRLLDKRAVHHLNGAHCFFFGLPFRGKEADLERNRTGHSMPPTSRQQAPSQELASPLVRCRAIGEDSGVLEDLDSRALPSHPQTTLAVGLRPPPCTLCASDPSSESW